MLNQKKLRIPSVCSIFHFCCYCCSEYQIKILTNFFETRMYLMDENELKFNQSGILSKLKWKCSGLCSFPWIRRNISNREKQYETIFELSEHYSLLYSSVIGILFSHFPKKKKRRRSHRFYFLLSHNVAANIGCCRISISQTKLYLLTSLKRSYVSATFVIILADPNGRRLRTDNH